MSVGSVLIEVRDERRRQDEKHGPIQAIPDGTGGKQAERDRDMAIALTDARAENGTVSWADVLYEEVMEAFAESDKAALRKELIQVGAVAVKWVEQIDREALA